MSAKIQTRAYNPDTCQSLIAAGADPLLARLCAARAVASPAELQDKLAGLLPHQSLKGCAEAAARLADAVLAREAF